MTRPKSKIGKNNQLFQWATTPVTIYVPNQELKDYYSSIGFRNLKEIIIGEPPTKIKL
ncbi:MAG: hypothetical protein K2K73_03355 [Ureaplasma sp.]|nr:hypothetical protein [Ureaplasma sp.]